MSNTLNSIMTIVHLDKDCKPTKETLLTLFFDLDFIENKEFYRDDTLKKGYKTEAARVIDEMIEKHENSIDLINACIEAQTSSSFYEASEVHTHTIDEQCIIVSIAYTY